MGQLAPSELISYCNNMLLRTWEEIIPTCRVPTLLALIISLNCLTLSTSPQSLTRNTVPFLELSNRSKILEKVLIQWCKEACGVHSDVEVSVGQILSPSLVFFLCPSL